MKGMAAGNRQLVQQKTIIGSGMWPGSPSPRKDMRILTAPIIFTNDDRNAIYSPGAVAFDGATIIEVGDKAKIARAYPDAEVVDLAGGIVTPGLVNLHHHLYSSFARGWNPDRTPKNFSEILRDVWWRLDEALSLDDIYYSALVGLCDSVRCGVTAVVDHHSSQKIIEGSLAAVARAFGDAGLRGSVCFELSDRHEEAFAPGLEESARAIESLAANELITSMVGLHASMTLTHASLEKVADLARRYSAGCHFHCAEDISDQEDAIKKYNQRVVERFAGYGILGEKSLAVHGVHLDQTEIKLLGVSRTSLAICPRSNQNNAVGAMRWWECAGVDIGFGTDGIDSDIIGEAKTALYAARHISGDPSFGFARICSMLLKGGPAVFEKITGAKIGSIAPGFPADMVHWNYDAPTPVTPENIGGHYIYGLSKCPADSAWIAGEKVLDEGRFAKLDYAETMARARELAGNLWARL
jgi:putative selenium metabolism protein SsnA